jgi:predicted  nucleic acid-binding Zn-ribbon protein
MIRFKTCHKHDECVIIHDARLSCPVCESFTAALVDELKDEIRVKDESIEDLECKLSDADERYSEMEWKVDILVDKNNYLKREVSDLRARVERGPCI